MGTERLTDSEFRAFIFLIGKGEKTTFDLNDSEFRAFILAKAGTAVAETPSGQHESPGDSAKLINILSKMDGERDEKEAWLGSGIGDEILASVDADLPDAATAKQRHGAAIRITIARYRAYLKRGEREFRGADKKRAEAARIDSLRDSLKTLTPRQPFDRDPQDTPARAPRQLFDMDIEDL